MLLGCVAGLALALSGYARVETVERGCAAATPTGPTVRLEYRLDAGTERVTPTTRDESLEVICRRLLETGVGGALVEPLAADRIAVTLPGPGAAKARRATGLVAVSGRMYLSDWEPNLIGRESTLGGHPDQLLPPPGAMRQAEREWTAAGRSVRRPENARLIEAGAFPNAYGAVKLASERPSRNPCGGCSASTPHFYLFGDGPTHPLLAGPVDSRADLRAGHMGGRRGGIVLRVPVGTRIVSERPIDSSGAIESNRAPGWYALKDVPVLSGSDLIDVGVVADDLGELAVVFGFSDRGRAAFERVTRTIARRARATVRRHIGAAAAAALSGHLAVIFDGEVKNRPIINFVENPNGIDGRTGAQISGWFRNSAEARRFAMILRIGALPLNLTLIRVDRKTPLDRGLRQRALG